jgi:hypothetical protein
VHLSQLRFGDPGIGAHSVQTGLAWDLLWREHIPAPSQVGDGESVPQLVALGLRHAGLSAETGDEVAQSACLHRALFFDGQERSFCILPILPYCEVAPQCPPAGLPR